MLHSGVQLYDLTSRALDDPCQKDIMLCACIHKTNSHKCKIQPLHSKVGYSRKMDLLTAFGFILAVNFAPWFFQQSSDIQDMGNTSPIPLEVS